MQTLLLNKSDVGQLIDLDRILLAVEDGYKSFQKGLVIQPDFMTVCLPETHKGIDFKAGLDVAGGYISVKSSSGGYDNNPSLGLPIGMNTVLLYDAETSALRCIMDGTWITGCRTAAAGAISIKYLARNDVRNLSIIGTGRQARKQFQAAMRIRNFENVYLWGQSSKFLDEFYDEITKEARELNVFKCSTAKEAVENADVLITVTRGRYADGPIVKKEWVKSGTHIVAVGADMPDKQELDPSLFATAKVVNDSSILCAKNGETHHAIEDGFITQSDIYAEIGEIILNNKNGRIDQKEITIFDTVGMAIQDNVMAAMLFTSAEEMKLGNYYNFLE